MMLKKLFCFMFFLRAIYPLKAQEIASEYPKVVGYMSIVHPMVTAYQNETVYNFNNDYTVGFPVGINILKSDRIGFSFEITPFVKVANGNSAVSNMLFHPGIILRYPKGFSINNRLAFETSGRFGYTAVFSKVIVRTKMNNFFVAMPLPLRFGNNKSASIGIGLQMGITF
ncbi:hypothetical protein VB264_16370 [Arcicella aquatica]|uniref:Uncharacterized protein n=1 Tax=Arcicella aquatica TaxID=217141 RepID=A0ABU5QRK0_9BACT|nr:hypothetical protein [Arcicella aquatica]MEA5259375.1 hypothetical protein [Arcicella aquatica]